MTIQTTTDGDIFIVTINRPAVRNAIDGPTAIALADAFRKFESDDALSVAILTGSDGTFCAGADLKSIAADDNPPTVTTDGDAPLGVSRMLLSKPTIAAVEGHAVAGGLELALWCDLRVAATDAVFGVYCRRWGVPLVDGGTVRLPRLIGHSRALDMILTGRPVSGEEALSFGLANRLVEPGQALASALKLAKQLAILPQTCLRSDRLSSYEQYGQSFATAMENETTRGIQVLDSRESFRGATKFAAGQGRHGAPLSNDGS